MDSNTLQLNENSAEEPDSIMTSSSDSSEGYNIRNEPQCRTKYKLGLDLHYVTSNIISMASPSAIDDDRIMKDQLFQSTKNENQTLLECDDSDCSISETSQQSGPLHHRDNFGTFSGPQSPTKSKLNSDFLSSIPIGCSLSEDSLERKENDRDQHSHVSLSNLKQEAFSRRDGNCPMKVSEYLNSNHRDHHLLFNISGNDPCTRTKMLLDNQIVNLPWTCPGINYSKRMNDEILPHCPTAASIPTLNCLIDICYALNAFIKLDKENTVVVYCSNGKTRTGIAIAAYLKYSGLVRSALDGFRMFCSRTCQKIVDMDEVDGLIPPSLKTLFRNFDTYLECGEYPQQSKLLLHAVTLQGVPVDDLPRIDIFDDQGLIYSSHLEVRDNSHNEADDDLKQTLMWADEEGFYRVNKPVMGDFLTLVRFGGDYAQDTNDPTKVILRYANNTAFLYPSTLELPKNKVDIMRRYCDSVDAEDFLVTFIFDEWRPEKDSTTEEYSTRFPDFLFWGKEALYRGLCIINSHHAVIDSGDHCERSCTNNLFESDSTALKNYYHGSVEAKYSEIPTPSVLLLHLALQLSNGDLYRAVNEFLECKMKHFWKLDSFTNLFSLPILKRDSSDFDLSVSRTSDQIDAESYSSKSSGRTSSVEECKVDVLRVVNKSCLLHSPSLEPFPKYSWLDDKSQAFLTSAPPHSSSHDISDKQVTNLNASDIESLHEYHRKCDPSAAMDVMMHIVNDSVKKDDLITLYDQSAISINQSRQDCIIDKFTPEMPSNLDYYIQSSEVKYFEPYNYKRMFGWDKQVHQLLYRDDKSSKFGTTLTSSLQIKLANHHAIDGLIISKDRNYFYIRVPIKEFPEEEIEGNTPIFTANEEAANRKIHKTESISESTGAISLSKEYSANATLHQNNSNMNKPIMDLDPDKSLKSQQTTSAEATESDDSGPPLKDDPEYTKYFKMLKMGLPLDAVKHAMKRDGKDESIMDLDPVKPFSAFKNKPHHPLRNSGPPLKDDPEYTKYFKMLKMGLPIGAVKNALQRDGRDPSIMDLDPNKSLQSQIKKTLTEERKEKKIKVRRKKIYWNAIDKSKVRKDSIWGQIMGMVNLEKLDYDTNEFESLFTESLDPAHKKTDSQRIGKDKPKQKKSVQVIDGKRGMNGGIILARLKMNFKEMAHIIDYM